MEKSIFVEKGNNQQMRKGTLKLKKIDKLDYKKKRKKIGYIRKQYFY